MPINIRGFKDPRTQKMADELVETLKSYDGVPYEDFFALFGIDPGNEELRARLRAVVRGLVSQQFIHQDHEAGVYRLGPPNGRVSDKQADVETERADDLGAQMYYQKWSGVKARVVSVSELDHVIAVRYSQDRSEQDWHQVLLSGPVKLWIGREAPDLDDGFGPQMVAVWNVSAVKVEYKDPQGKIHADTKTGLTGMRIHLFVAPWKAN